MIPRTSTSLSAASLIAALALGPSVAAEWATKEEAIAMVKQAVVLIRSRDQTKLTRNLQTRLDGFTIEIFTSLSSVLRAKSSPMAKGKISSAKT